MGYWRETVQYSEDVRLERTGYNRGDTEWQDSIQLSRKVGKLHPSMSDRDIP